MKSEQMKSNKTGSHITGRATNEHWNGSNAPPPPPALVHPQNGGKKLQLWKKKGKKKSQVVILPKAALSASTKKIGPRGAVDGGRSLMLTRGDRPL